MAKSNEVNPAVVILDTDLSMGEPGSEIDDGFALALLLAEERLKLELLTTVFGNTGVETVTNLSRDMLDRFGYASTRVVQGAAGPLRGSPIEGDSVTSKPGGQTDPTQNGARQAAVAMTELAAERAGEVTVIAIGPLTNVAAAIELDPGFTKNLKEIVVMGGVFMKQMNRRDMPGEFNFWNDPEAVEIVLKSGANIRIVGLDVTEKVRINRSEAQMMLEDGEGFASFAGECILSWLDRLQANFPGAKPAIDSCAIHDALAVGAIVREDLFTWAPAHLGIVTGASIARGHVVCDFLTTSEPPTPNALVAVDVLSQDFETYFRSKFNGLPFGESERSEERKHR